MAKRNTSMLQARVVKVTSDYSTHFSKLNGASMMSAMVYAAEDADIKRDGILAPVTVTYQSRYTGRCVQELFEVKKDITFYCINDFKKLVDFVKFDPTAKITVKAENKDGIAVDFVITRQVVH